MESRAPVIVVAGCTATGKSAAAIELALRLGGEVVSADSVQVYRGFDIGSAKPTLEERRGVPHHLIDVIDPGDAIDAAEFAARADAAIAEIVVRGRVPIVTGGAGLWLQALLRGLVALPPVDAALRARIEQEAIELGDHALHARLRVVDPGTAARLHARDRLRIVRALEVHAQTGRPLGEMQREHALGLARYPTFLAVLERDRGELRERIDRRVDAMITRGWLAEVDALLDRFGAEVRAFGSIGYRQLKAHRTEGVSLEDALTSVRKATWIYARRQRTWFASAREVTWRGSFDELLSTELDRALRSHLRGEGGVTGTGP